ncbi:hypothetical protein ACFX14_003714 [Malus domestica]
MPELGSGEKHGQAQLLDGWIIDLRLTEIAAEIKNSLFSSGVAVLCKEAADGLFGRRDVELKRLTTPMRNQDRWVRKGDFDLRKRRLMLIVPHKFIGVLESQKRGKRFHFTCGVGNKSTEEIDLGE